MNLRYYGWFLGITATKYKYTGKREKDFLFHTMMIVYSIFLQGHYFLKMTQYKNPAIAPVRCPSRLILA